VKRIEDIKEFEDIDTYYNISSLVEEIFQDRVEAHKHLVSANKEIERLNKIKQQVIDELFELKDMIYKPETREINFDVQRKISSMIVKLGSDKE
jgi:hypothetical protein